jgi:hypothetical protein
MFHGGYELHDTEMHHMPREWRGKRCPNSSWRIVLFYKRLIIKCIITNGYQLTNYPSWLSKKEMHSSLNLLLMPYTLWSISLHCQISSYNPQEFESHLETRWSELYIGLCRELFFWGSRCLIIFPMV